MLVYFGITELIGEAGSGKTSIAVEESKIYKTLYLTSTNFPIRRYDFTKSNYEDCDIEFVQTISSLLYVINHKMKAKAYELIVIDNLFHIVFLESRSRMEVTNVIYLLKRLIQKYGLKVLVINTCSFETLDRNKVSFISRLGLNWEYHVNAKYVSRKKGDVFMVELVKSPVNLKLSYNYKIERSHITLIN